MQALGNERLNNRVFPEACVNLSPGEGSFLSSKDGDNAHKALKAETKAPHLVFISFWTVQFIKTGMGLTYYLSPGPSWHVLSNHLMN